MKISQLSIIALFTLCLLFSCRKDEWDKRNRISDPALAENLLQAINDNPDLSEFSQYLSKTGFDKVIASSKTFTVWAPTNEALGQLDPAELKDTAKLRLLIANHIAFRAYATAMAKPAIRVKTLSGKYVTFSGTQVNDADIVQGDTYANNGMLHVIDKALIPEMNIWDYLMTDYGSSLQGKALQDLEYMYVDPDSAELVGLDPQTGEPIYKPGTGLVKRNRFLQRVNISSEDSSLTYLILADAAFTDEVNKLTPYFTDSTAQETDSLTKWNIVKDLAFRGIYSPDSLPPTLYSANDSVQFHLDKGAIIKTQKVSNGIVYVVNRLSYDMPTKIKPVILEGEQFYDRMDPDAGYTIRKRRIPGTDSIFNDIYMDNYGLASYWLRYPTTLNSVTYHVYWVAFNDFQTGTFPMRIGFNPHADTAYADPAAVKFADELDYHTVELNDYHEVYIGDYTPDYYGMRDVFLIGNNVKTNGQNTIVCDYIKLVPVIN